MRIRARLKWVIMQILPTALAKVLQNVWQSTRYSLNKLFFQIKYPSVIVVKPKEITHGQLNQPVLLDYLLGGRHGGTFLDIGANHPTYNNNSVFFEIQRHYTGHAFDPLETYAHMWKSERPMTVFYGVALGGSVGQVRFYEHANVDGWADQLSYTANSRIGDGEVPSRLVDLQRLDSIEGIALDVDFASIDVEGAEEDVLMGFGNQIRPKILLIENCSGIYGSNRLRELVKDLGYRLVVRVGYIDDVYVRGGQVDILRRVDNLIPSLDHAFSTR